VRNTPGIQKMWEATGRGGDGGSYYNSRGFIMQSQLRNGIAGIVTSEIDAINLDKLEVIKGPSATLFGSTLTSYGGLLNRVTKKPFDKFGGEVTAAGGSYDFKQLSADINAPLDAAKKMLSASIPPTITMAASRTRALPGRWLQPPAFCLRPPTA
jgi:iron complex outermembrane receptor protein